MKNRSSRNLALAVAVIFAGLVLPLAGASTSGDDGIALFTKQKCDSCHAVKKADIEAKTTSKAMLGPDLSGYAFKTDFETLSAFVRKEGELDGKTHNKPFKGTDEELKVIVDWLGSLE